MTRLLFALTFSLFSAIALAETERSDRREAMVTPASEGETVVEIWQGGRWNYAGVEGYYKVLYTEYPYNVAGEPATHRVYLQWVRDDESGTELAYSLRLKELSEVPAYRLARPVCDAQASCETLRLPAVHVAEDRTVDFSLTFETLGQYDFDVEL